MSRTAPVHVWLPGASEPVLAGEFEHNSSATAFGRFRYVDAYVAAKHPALAPDLPVKAKIPPVLGGSGIYPLFLDAGPDAWGRRLLARRLGRDVDPLEALILCPADGVGNIALGPLTPERLRVLTVDEFLAILADIAAGQPVRSILEQQVHEAFQGTSLGGTKPKLSIVRGGKHYLAKFPEQADDPWLPHVECATLKLARECGIDACAAEVWHLPDHGRCGLLVERFDRTGVGAAVGRRGFVSAHALLRLDQLTPAQQDTLQYGTQGYTAAALQKSYVAFADALPRWCKSQALQWEMRRELWRRIVFNALVRNIDDHAKNHGLLCEDMASGVWKLSPAFDLLPAAAGIERPALAMAYHYVPPRHRGRTATPGRLVTVVDTDDLVAAGAAHYGVPKEEGAVFLRSTAERIAARWRDLMAAEGMPAPDIERYANAFALAAQIAESRPGFTGAAPGQPRPA